MKRIVLMVMVCLGLMLAAGSSPAATPVAVVVVDLQADFTTAHKGSLAVAGTDKPFIAQCVQATKDLKAAGLPIFATQDWHPADHMSFAANHQDQKPFNMITLADGRKQVLWPNHCVQNTEGARILMECRKITKVVQKGSDPKYDSYSGFKDDGGARTGLAQLLKMDGVRTIIVYGIATDYCVKATAIDGVNAGFKVIVVQDLCRGVAPETSKAAWEEMRKAGVELWPSLDLNKAKAL